MTVTRRSALAVGAAVLVAAAACASAQAKTVRYNNIVSPSKLIYCFAVMNSSEIECHANYLKRIGELDPYLALRPRGRSRSGERGDFPGYPTRRRTLRYGDVWARPGIRCTMRTTGLTCRNRDKHGFHIQKGNVRRF